MRNNTSELYVTVSYIREI